MLDGEAKKKIGSISTKIDDIEYRSLVLVPIFIIVLFIYLGAVVHNYVESQRDKTINKKLDQLIEQVETLKGTKNVSGTSGI